MTSSGIYKKGHGVYGRVIVGIALGILALFVSVSLYNVLIDLPNIATSVRVPLVGVGLNWGLVAAFVLFLVIGFFASVFVIGFETGIRPLDSGSKKTVEYLIDTQGELQKVSWPTRYELFGSTAVVIISVVVIGVFVLGVDWLVAVIMEYIGVL